MNKWRLLLFAVFCIFQPISSENLFNGRERCLQQRPDYNRKDSRLLEHQSKARSEVRGVDYRNGKEFPERADTDYELRLSEWNRDQNIRSVYRGSRSNERESLTRQRIADTVNEYNPYDRRSLGKERTEPELGNVREERRLDNYREVRNSRTTRGLPQEDRRKNEREETRARYSQSEYVPIRRTLEYDEIRSRKVREINDRTKSRSISRDSQIREVRPNSNIIYDLRNDDSRRLNNVRLQRELKGFQNRRENTRINGATFNNDGEDSLAIRRVNEQRSLQKRKADEFRAILRELKEGSDGNRERIVRLNDLRRQTNERSYSRAERNVPSTRHISVRLDLTRLYSAKVNRRSPPTTANRALEREESAQQREIDESRQSRRKSTRSSDTEYDRESVERKEPEKSRDFHREIKYSTDKANERVIRSDDLILRTNANERVNIQARANAFINRRGSPVTTGSDNERRNEPVASKYFRRETRSRDRDSVVSLDNLGRRADQRLSSQNLRNVHRDGHRNFRMDIARNNNQEISRRVSPNLMRNADERINYMQSRNSEISRNFRSETNSQRNDDSFIDRTLSSGRRTSYARNISERREAAVEMRDDTRHFRRGSRSNSGSRFEDFSRRVSKRLQSLNGRLYKIKRSRSVSSNAARAQETIERRSSRQTKSLDEQSSFRRELRVDMLDNKSRRDNNRLNSRRVSRQNLQLGEENRQVDGNRRSTRGITLTDRTVSYDVREENEAAKYSRDNERTKELSLDRTVSMPYRRQFRQQFQSRIQREISSRLTRSNQSKLLRDASDLRIRMQRNDISNEQRNFEEVKTIERRAKEDNSQDYNRYESRYVKNRFDRNEGRDGERRLRLDSIGNRQNSNRYVLFIRDTAKNVKDDKSLRKELRVSMVSHDEPSEGGFSFKWQHLLYLLQAAYIVGLFAKLPMTKENCEKKTRIGIWNHSSKLIKVD